MSAPTSANAPQIIETAALLNNFALTRRDHALWMENVSLGTIAHEHGTPVYVYSRAALTGNFHALNNAIGDARKALNIGHSHLICYAVKANSNLAILNLFARLGAGFDLVSGGELARVLAAGGDARKVVFSGVGKTEAEMRAALLAGIKCFNVESIPELSRLNRIAGELGVKAPISLRVNPNVDAKTHPYISTGLSENKFGIAHDHALDTYKRAADMANLEIHGIDCHIGSQLLDLAPLVEGMERLIELVDALYNVGIKLTHVCPGGGIGISYQGEAVPDLSGYAHALARAQGSRPLELLLEPGRSMVGNAGVLVTKIEHVKTNPTKNFVVVDAAMNDLIRPALYSAYHEVLRVNDSTAHASFTCDVVGPICETSDFLAQGRKLGCAEGELLAIASTGAYAMTMASNYNTRPRGAEIMVDDAVAHVIRPRENVSDLFASERCLPDDK
jgi:diaminopimelate decarboxylase